MTQHHNNWLDIGAICTFIATVIGWVPAILAPFTAILTFMWAFGRTWEMFTGTKIHETKVVRQAYMRLKAWRSG